MGRCEAQGAIGGAVERPADPNGHPGRRPAHGVAMSSSASAPCSVPMTRAPTPPVRSPHMTRTRTANGRSSIYRALVRSHCRPVNEVKLHQVTVRQIDDLLHHVATTVSPATAGDLHRSLRTAFGVAVRRGLVPANPCRYATIPRVMHIEVQPLRVQEVHLVLAVAAEDRNAARMVGRPRTWFAAERSPRTRVGRCRLRKRHACCPPPTAAPSLGNTVAPTTSLACPSPGSSAAPGRRSAHAAARPRRVRMSARARGLMRAKAACAAAAASSARRPSSGVASVTAHITSPVEGSTTSKGARSSESIQRPSTNSRLGTAAIRRDSRPVSAEVAGAAVVVVIRVFPRGSWNFLRSARHAGPFDRPTPWW